MGFGKLWKLIMQFSRTWKVLENEDFSIWRCKSFGFLFGKVLKYPEMDFISWCRSSTPYILCLFILLFTM